MNKDKGVVFIVARVTFDEELCKGCELCVSVCPVKIILMDRDRVNKNGYHLQPSMRWTNVQVAGLVL